MPDYFTTEYSIITNGNSTIQVSKNLYGEPRLYEQNHRTYDNIDNIYTRSNAQQNNNINNMYDSTFRETKHLWGSGFIYSDEPIKPKPKRLKFDDPEKPPNWE